MEKAPLTGGTDTKSPFGMFCGEGGYGGQLQERKSFAEDASVKKVQAAPARLVW